MKFARRLGCAPSHLALFNAGLLLSMSLITMVVSRAAAQPPASPVRYTVALQETVRGQLRVPGSVESRASSVVASEVAGIVARKRVREGRELQAGATLVELRTDALELRLDSAKGQLGEAEARLARARQAHERSEGLRERGLVSDDEFDGSYAEFQAWSSKVLQLNADIAGIELDIERCTIRSPFSGMVVSERVDVGEWLAVGAPVMEVVALDDLQVRVEVAAQYFHQLRLGDAATVRFEAIGGHEVMGSVTALIAQADPRARSFPVLVGIANKDHVIAVGMLAQVSLPLGEGHSAVLVPKDAIVRKGSSQIVTWIGDDETVQQSEVTTGNSYGAWIEVVSGVSSGTRVVTRGNERLRPGQSVVGEVQEYELP